MRSNGTAVMDPSTVTPTLAPGTRRRKAGTRLSGGHLVMIVAGLLAFILVVVVLRDNKATVTVAVASSDIQPGSSISLNDIHSARLPANSSIAGSLLTVEQVKSAKNKVASRLIPKGDPVTVSALVAKGTSSGQRTMSIPLSPDKANGGDIKQGDFVDVLAIADDGSAYTVGSNLQVVAASHDKSSFGSSNGFSITVAVSEQQSLDIAAAIDTGKVQAVRANGAQSGD